MSSASSSSEIVDGWQEEVTDKWLRFGNPWELARPEWAVEVRFGGHTERWTDEQGRRACAGCRGAWSRACPTTRRSWAIAVNTANTLRLWRAEAPESFDFSAFNRGDYYGAVEQKIISENITKVLYPNDEQLAGKELRLEQQYFFVSCSLQDMLRILRVQKIPSDRLHEKFAVQLNDTHPSIGVAELMRLLVDEQQLDWDRAWAITQPHLRLHQSHAAARGARTLAAASCSARCCRGTWRSSTRSTRRFLDEVRIAFPAMKRARRACR